MPLTVSNTPITVTVKNNAGLLTQPGIGGYTLNNLGAVAASVTSIGGLSDVHLTAHPPVNNSTLVYNSSTGVYDVKEMNVDGGVF